MDVSVNPDTKVITAKQEQNALLVHMEPLASIKVKLLEHPEIANAIVLLILAAIIV